MGVVWKSVELALKDKKMDWWARWEEVLPDALHSIRTLMNTSTRETPYSRFLGFPRKSAAGSALPKWLLEAEGDEIWVRNFTRRSKLEPRVKKAKLIEVFPSHAFVEYGNGRRSSVALKDVARKGLEQDGNMMDDSVGPVVDEEEEVANGTGSDDGDAVSLENGVTPPRPTDVGSGPAPREETPVQPAPVQPRRSTRETRRPTRYDDYVLYH